MKKLKAGALVYVIVLSLIIISLLGLIIMRSFYLSTDINLLLEKDKIHDNINSVVNILDEDSSLLNFEDEQQVFDSSSVNVLLKKKHWGLLNVIQISARASCYKDSVIFLSAACRAKEDKTALWISDKGNYISISGYTYLKGNCFIPRLGMRKTYVEKQSYSRNIMIDGEVLRSKAQLKALSKNIEGRFYSAIERKGSEIILIDSLDNSFTKESLVLYSVNTIDLSGKYIKGNVKIISDEAIRLDSTSFIDNCLICAPNIIIESGFKGRLQAFASNKILVGEGVSLEYPSYLFLKSNNRRADIYLGKDALIKGGVLMQANKKSLFTSEKGSFLEGQVYIYAKASLQGKIYGNAYIDKLVYDSRWSKYEDILFNTLIDRSLLNDDKPCLNLFSEEKKQILLEWLK